MIAWLFLVGAIAFEVFGTTSLRMFSVGKANRRWLIGVVVGFLAAFACLTGTLANGLALGIAYGVWAASGVAITAILSRILFKEPLTVIMSIGIALVIGGVLLVELGAPH